MLNHRPPPNWVAERAKCNLETTFEALCQIVKRDVDEMNKLSVKRRGGHAFRFDECAQGTEPFMRVRRFPEGDPDSESAHWITFRLTINAIIVEPMIAPQKTRYEVVPRWNEKAGSCELFIGDDVFEVWQVSQRALSPLFFG